MKKNVFVSYGSIHGLQHTYIVLCIGPRRYFYAWKQATSNKDAYRYVACSTKPMYRPLLFYCIIEMISQLSYFDLRSTYTYQSKTLNFFPFLPIESSKTFKCSQISLKPLNLRYTSVPHPFKLCTVSPPPKYSAYALPRGRPYPSPASEFAPPGTLLIVLSASAVPFPEAGRSSS